MPFSNFSPNILASDTCGVCGANGTFKKYAECKSKERAFGVLYICTNCTVLYDASAEIDLQNVKDAQFSWGEDSEFYKVPEGEDFRLFVNQCDATFKFFEEHLGVQFRGTYLDICAGNGMRAVAALNYFDRVIVFDYVLDRLVKTKKIVNSDRYQIADSDVLSTIQADTILIWHAMEHLLSPSEVFKLCARILKPGGHLLLQVPLLSAEHVHPVHYWFYNEVAFTIMAEQAGLAPIRFFYDHAHNIITGTFKHSD